MNAEAHAWIELKNVGKRYGQQSVLDGANMTVERGQFVAVMGRRGCGSSAGSRPPMPASCESTARTSRC
jgi:sulfonate transport system ATP-binding protein